MLTVSSCSGIALTIQYDQIQKRKGNDKLQLTQKCSQSHNK